MRSRLAPLSALALGTLVIAACSSTAELDDVDATGDALSRRGVAPIGRRPPAPKPPAPRPPVVAAPVATAVNPSPSPSIPTACCQPVTIDVQRTTRSCTNLPGAYVESGKVYVDGVGGRWGAAQRPAPAGAPPALANGACTYTWYPQGCTYADNDKLLLDEGDWSFVTEGAKVCYYRSTPAGLGRCDVCGVTSNDFMYAVLPSDWSSFSYWAGSQRFSVTLPPEQHFFQADVGYDIADELVTVYAGDNAPATQP